ncbi:MAG: TIGR03905 family TSCPD domain-containing protein [Bacteroidales bacterium]|nr:TIGR03905 family TSCPD domain-containing protein [Bacteroidales bacterium]
MAKYSYKTQGTCSSQINIEVENGVIIDVEFLGGCNGNLQGISRLVKGMRSEDAVARLEGIKCGFKPTSCPDQLAQALKLIAEKD